jgi:hypothetical protein
MRTAALSAALLFTLAYSLNGQSISGKYDFSGSVVTIGGGMNYFEDDSFFEFEAGLGNLFFTHKKTNIGMEIDVLKVLIYYYGNHENDIDKISFLNPTLYWDIIGKDTVLLGPYVSAHYLVLSRVFMPESGSRVLFDFRGATVSAGMRFSLRVEWEKDVVQQMLGCELGYRNNLGKHSVYFSITTGFPIN